MAVKVGNSWVSEAALAYAKERTNDKTSSIMYELSNQYPEINFSTNTAPFSQNGVKNIQIAPNILAEMQNDPEKRLEYEALIYDCATGIDMLNHSGGGFHTKAAGFIINADGSLGAWGISVSDDGASQSRSKVKLDKNKKETWADKILAKQKEKRVADKKEEKIRMEQKTEISGSTQGVDIQISDEGKMLQQAQQQEQQSEKVSGEEDNTQTGKVAVNVGKRARQIAAAKTQAQVRAVLSILQNDLQDVEEGLKNGMCDQKEVDKVKALISQAQARMGQVSAREATPDEENAFAMSSLM